MNIIQYVSFSVGHTVFRHVSSCYRSTSWLSASQACEQNGHHLWTVKSLEDQIQSLNVTAKLRMKQFGWHGFGEIIFTGLHYDVQVSL